MEPYLVITVRLTDAALAELGAVPAEDAIRALLQQSGFVRDAAGGFVPTVERVYDPMVCGMVYRQVLLQ